MIGVASAKAFVCHQVLFVSAGVSDRVTLKKDDFTLSEFHRLVIGVRSLGRKASSGGNRGRRREESAAFHGEGHGEQVRGNKTASSLTDDDAIALRLDVSGQRMVSPRICPRNVARS